MVILGKLPYNTYFKLILWCLGQLMVMLGKSHIIPFFSVKQGQRGSCWTVGSFGQAINDNQNFFRHRSL